MYENQNLGIIMPEMILTVMVWTIRVIPMDNGLDNLMKIEFMIKRVALISELSLLVKCWLWELLRGISPSSEVLRVFPILVYKTNVLYKLLKLIELFVFCLIGFICYFSGVWRFVNIHKHLLVTLLRLEYIVLVVFFLISFFVSFLVVEGYLLLFFLVFSVCEGVLGLALMVVLARSHGGDSYSSYNILEC